MTPRLRTAIRRFLPGTALVGLALLATALPVLAQTTESFRPELQVSIPGVTFQPINVTNETSTIDIPWIAIYINGVYKYGIYVAGLLASVMFVIGGFEYLTAGSSDRVNRGKKRITDAIAGVILLLLSYVILQTVNPDLVNPAVLSIRTAERSREFPGSAAATEAVGADKVYYQLAPQDKESSNTYVAAAINCPNKTISQEIRTAAYESEKVTRVPAGLLLAQWSLESNNGESCIGTNDGKNKFNCWGVKCLAGGGREVPIVDGATRPSCPSSCVSRKTKELKGGVLAPYYACFQVFNTFDEAVTRHAKAVQRDNWEEYADNPKGYAKFIQSLKPSYATDPNYSHALILRMRQHCLDEPIPAAPGMPGGGFSPQFQGSFGQ